MSRKSIIKPYKLFDAVSMATSSDSLETNVEQVDKASIMVYWTGTAPVGVLTVLAKNGSNDTYRALDFDEVINITGNSDYHVILMETLTFTHIKLHYEATSGVGNLTYIITAKVEGA